MNLTTNENKVGREIFQVGVIGALLIPIVYGADLTGRWVASTQTPDGQKRETVIALRAEGDRLTGYMPGKAPATHRAPHADRGKFSDEYAAEIPSHGVVMVRVH